MNKPPQLDLGKVEGLLALSRAYAGDRICKSEIMGIMTAKTKSSPPRLANLYGRVPVLVSPEVFWID